MLFASKAEMKRYIELEYLQMAGEIDQLSRQPQFKFEVRSLIRRPDDHMYQIVIEKKFSYRADFKYRLPKTDQWVIDDKKGYLKPEQAERIEWFKTLYPEFLFVLS